LVDGDHSRTIALICAVGGRTAFLQAHLVQHDDTSIINVAEGMLGSRHGPGWVDAELPLTPYVASD